MLVGVMIWICFSFLNVMLMLCINEFENWMLKIFKRYLFQWLLWVDVIKCWRDLSWKSDKIFRRFFFSYFEGYLNIHFFHFIHFIPFYPFFCCSIPENSKISHEVVPGGNKSVGKIFGGKSPTDFPPIMGNYPPIMGNFPLSVGK